MNLTHLRRPLSIEISSGFRMTSCGRVDTPEVFVLFLLYIFNDLFCCIPHLSDCPTELIALGDDVA